MTAFPMGLDDVYRKVATEQGFDPLFEQSLAEALADVEDADEPEVRYCEAQVFAGNRIDPPEFCDEEAEDGSDYCAKHGATSEDAYEDYMIEREDARTEDPDAW